MEFIATYNPGVFCCQQLLQTGMHSPSMCSNLVFSSTHVCLFIRKLDLLCTQVRLLLQVHRCFIASMDKQGPLPPKDLAS